jgi:hypothetical protein
MPANNFSISKYYDHLHHKLSSLHRTLEQGEIEAEVDQVRQLLERVGPDMFSQFLPDRPSLEVPDEAQWQKIIRDLESHFNVRLPGGSLVIGEEQRKRDLLWWTDRAKISKETYYWTRYHAWMRKSLPPDVVHTVDQDTDRVMNNVGDPSTDSFLIRGMVVGHVQSGKTGNYSALACKAADAGYRFIVVIAGGTDSLRDQTQERLNESFVGSENGQQVGAGIGYTTPGTLPICLTTKERDFNRRDADRMSQGINFDNVNSPILIVIKKNPNSLNNVIDWLRRQYRNVISTHSMLVIDDESDYASINYNNENVDPSVINRRIRELLGLFRKGTYVAYTATPFANIFIDHNAEAEAYGGDLFPKDFIFALEAPTNYFGARKIFLDTDGRHLVVIPQDEIDTHLPLKHKQGDDLTISPTLKDAIRLFILNVGIRWIRGQHDKHNSMLIHVSRFTRIHSLISSQVTEYFEELKRNLFVYGKLHNSAQISTHISDLKETFQRRLKVNLGTSEEWPDVVASASDAVSTILIREAHQNSRVRVEYKKNLPTNVIVIGGATLSRGYTLEGLSVSYFLRSTLFYDTLMQMGRWFGYRPQYEDLCRIYMSETSIDHFERIISASQDLMESFDFMATNNLTPLQFGLSVRRHPGSVLQITARNKLRNARELTVDMSLDGHLKETARFSNMPDDAIANRILINDLIRKLGSTRRHPVGKTRRHEFEGNSYLWRDVDGADVREFLNTFRVYTADATGLSDRLPLPFIKAYAEQWTQKWDVALYGGKGELVNVADVVKIARSKRQMVTKNGYFEIHKRQVSTGSAEAIALYDNGKTYGSDRKKVRRDLTKPLLMLYLIESAEGEFPAFGVSFPGDATTNRNKVTMLVNTVSYSQIIEDLEIGEYDE